jgi:hypothetical protein
MKRFTCKVYVVQKADREGRLGDVLAANVTLRATEKSQPRSFCR